jgi:ABC-2 type transport system permease protein
MVVHQTSDNALGPWAGYAVFCAWGAVILLVAAVLMNRRDA